MADPMKIRAAMAGDKVEVKVLMSHEMETGQRKDANGAVIPAQGDRPSTQRGGLGRLSYMSTSGMKTHLLK